MSESLEEINNFLVVELSHFHSTSRYHRNVWGMAGLTVFNKNDSNECKELWRVHSKKIEVPPVWLEDIENLWEIWTRKKSQGQPYTFNYHFRYDEN